VTPSSNAITSGSPDLIDAQRAARDELSLTDIAVRIGVGRRKRTGVDANHKGRRCHQQGNCCGETVQPFARSAFHRS
jgi:hypothetical protein